MCVIILAPDSFPSEEMLRAANKVNKDGAGISWVENGQVHFSKGNLTADEILAYKSFTQPPYLIHFRLATQGGNSHELAHPFSLDLETADAMEGTCSAVLAHNGTWVKDKWEPFLYKTMQGDPKTRKLNIPRGFWSDSKAIAYIYSIHKETFLEFINEKVAILDSNGNLRWWGVNGGEKGWNKIKEGNHEIIVSNIVWKKQLEGDKSVCVGGVCG